MRKPHKERLRVALVCPGIGWVQRGYERYMADLFAVMRRSDLIEPVLYKGRGVTAPDERVPLFLARHGIVQRHLPFYRLLNLGRKKHRAPMHIEALTFAIGILPSLVSGRIDVVHTVDPPLARVLAQFRRRFRLGFSVLHTEASDMNPRDYPPVDLIHQVSPAAFDAALDYGIPAGQMRLVPLGTDSARFTTSQSKRELRRKYVLSDDTFVVLCVAALNRYHKRIDYLIEEFSHVDGDCLLWADGSMDLGDTDLPALARERLGERCRITHVPSNAVGDLYNLADIMVLPSVSEAFGLVVVEAQSAGVPVLVHDSPHFNWLVRNEANHLDMRRPGALAQRLSALRDNRDELLLLRPEAEVRNRFEWLTLLPDYEALYQALGSLD